MIPQKVPASTKNPNTGIFLFDQILSESEQLRREVDSSGPQDELEYWKKRGAQFSQLVSYLQVCKTILL